MPQYDIYYHHKGSVNATRHNMRHSQEETMRLAKAAMYSREGRVGELQIINVTYNGEVIWKWQFGKGITYPSAAELAQHVGVEDDDTES